MGNNRIVTCRACGLQANKDSRYEMSHMIKVDSRQGNYFYVCNECKTTKYKRQRQPLLLSVVGKPKSHNYTFGIEVEITDIGSSLFLYENNFCLTSDGSVNGDGAEWVSPIYEGFTPIPKVLQSIYTDCSSYIDDSCGTHAHISNHDATQWSKLTRLLSDNETMYKIIKELDKFMLDNPSSTESFWGRCFNAGYAISYNREYWQNDYICNNRYLWINTQNLVFKGGESDTIEFRVNKFKSKDQYMNVLKFMRKFCDIIIDNYQYNPDYIGRLILQAYKKAIEDSNNQ